MKNENKMEKNLQLTKSYNLLAPAKGKSQAWIQGWCTPSLFAKHFDD
jgi:hypothetical protein